MSALSGSQAKGEKSTKKYQALNINNIFKGKSLETAQKTVIQKHGMQSLGKIASARRVPPPASLPSLKAENFGNDPSVNLVPPGGQGWNNKVEESGSGTGGESGVSQEGKATTASSVIGAAVVTSAQTSLVRGPTPPSTQGEPGATKTWGESAAPPSSMAAVGPSGGTPGLDGGPPNASSNQLSPYFHREFPKLGGGTVPGESTPHYGPGPSLRPQTEGSWMQGGGRGAATQPQGDERLLPLGVHNTNLFNGGLPPRGMPLPGAFGPSGVMGPQGSRGMMAPYMVRGTGHFPPTGYPANFPPIRPFVRGSGNGEGRFRGPAGGPHDEEPNIPTPIIRKDALEGFVDRVDIGDGWATSTSEVDYNDDESHEDSGGSERKRAEKRTESGRWEKEKSVSTSIPGREGKEEDSRSEGLMEKERSFERVKEKVQPQYRDFDHRGNENKQTRGGSDGVKWQRGGYERVDPSLGGARDYLPASGGRGTSSDPTLTDAQWRGEKRPAANDVSVAFERARQLAEEEERRFEEKKRHSQSEGRGNKGSSECHSSEKEGDSTAGGRSRGSSESRGLDDMPTQGSRADNIYRSQFGGRGDASYRSTGDSCHGEVGYDRQSFDPRARDGGITPRGGDQQPNFSSQFKCKLPPRFLKQQEMSQQQRHSQGPVAAPYRVPPNQPTFEPRFGASNQQNEGKENRLRTDSEMSEDVSVGIASKERQHHDDRFHERDARNRDDRHEHKDSRYHTRGGQERQAGSQRRSGGQGEHFDGQCFDARKDLDSDRRRATNIARDNRSSDSNRRFDSRRSFDERLPTERGAGGGEGDWNESWGDVDGQKGFGLDGASTHLDWDKEVEAAEQKLQMVERERPARPDSRASRESRNSRDSFDRPTIRDVREKDSPSWIDGTEQDCRKTSCTERDAHWTVGSERDTHKASSTDKDPHRMSGPDRDTSRTGGKERDTIRIGGMEREAHWAGGAATDETHRKGDQLLTEKGYSTEMHSDLGGSKETLGRDRDAGMCPKESQPSRPQQQHCPAPITRERLEASEKEVEVRKNMTTLKKVAVSVERMENRKTEGPRETPHGGGNREGARGSTVWGSGRGLPKNEERSHPPTDTTTRRPTEGSGRGGEGGALLPTPLSGGPTMGGVATMATGERKEFTSAGRTNQKEQNLSKESAQMLKSVPEGANSHTIAPESSAIVIDAESNDKVTTSMGGGRVTRGGSSKSNVGGRYESSRTGTGRGHRGTTTYQLYRGGRGGRGEPSRRAKTAAPRFQGGYSQDEGYYYYEEVPWRPKASRDRKVQNEWGVEGDWGAPAGGYSQRRYNADGTEGGGGSRGGRTSNRGGDRRPRGGGDRSKVGRTGGERDVSSVEESLKGSERGARKVPTIPASSRYAPEKIPPRFQQKCSQFEHRQRGAASRRGGRLSLSTAEPSSVTDSVSHAEGTVKEGSPETAEENDWETASESSDPEGRKDAKEKAAAMTVTTIGFPALAEKTAPRSGNDRRGALRGGGDKHYRDDYRNDGTGFHSSHSRYGERRGPPAHRGTDRIHHDVNAKVVSHNVLSQAEGKVPANGTVSEGKIVRKVERTNPLESIDLNNYASVVIVDDQPQVSEFSGNVSDCNDGFQEVTRRRSGKEKPRGGQDSPSRGEAIASQVSTGLTSVAAVKKPKEGGGKKSGIGAKAVGFERGPRQNTKLPPRLAKQREHGRGIIKEVGGDAAVGNQQQPQGSALFPLKDPSAMMPPLKNAWDKPLQTLRANSPRQGAIGTKPVSFDSHDSGVEIGSDNAVNSAGSSQRSSPSDGPAQPPRTVDTANLDGTSVPSETLVFENTKFRSSVSATVGAEYKAKFGSGVTQGQTGEQRMRERKTRSPAEILREDDSRNAVLGSNGGKPEPIEMPMSFSTTKKISTPAADNVENSMTSDMKLDFTFDTDLSSQVNEKVSVSAQSLNLSRQFVLSSGAGGVGGMHSPMSPSTDDLNLKIASVKKVWDVMPPVPEMGEDMGNTSVTVAFSSNAAFSDQGMEDALDPFKDPSPNGGSCDDTNMSQGYHQGGSPLPQGTSMGYPVSASGKMDCRVSSVNICKVRPQQQMLPNSISPGLSNAFHSGSLSPPLSTSSSMSTAGNNVYQTLSNAAAFGGLGGAIPSPPMLFSSTQQQLYQPFLGDLGQRGASQFAQFPTYGIGQGLGSNAFGQSLFLTTPPINAPADLYAGNVSQYRIQPAGIAGYGQSQSAVLMSSSNAALNTQGGLKAASSQQSYVPGGQPNFGTIGSKANTPFQQTSLPPPAPHQQPSQPLYIYDAQALNLIGSQLVQQRTSAVQSSVLQAMQQQTPNSYYSTTGTGGSGGGSPGTQQTSSTGGYYATSGSPLQAALQQQQQQASAPTYGLQSFGQSQQQQTVNLQHAFSSANLTMGGQQHLTGSQAFHGAPPTLIQQANFLKTLPPSGTSSGVSDSGHQQLKSPGSAQQQNVFSSFFPATSVSVSLSSSPSGYESSNLQHHFSQDTKAQMMRQMPPSAGVGGPQANFNQGPQRSYHHATVQQNVPQATNTQVRPPMPMGMQLSGSQGVLGLSASRYPTPIQRPSAPTTGVSNPPPYRGTGGGRMVSNPLSVPPPQQMSKGPSPVGGCTNPTAAQQAKQRADALSATQAFFMRGDGGNKGDKKEGKNGELEVTGKEEVVQSGPTPSPPAAVVETAAN